MRRLIRILVVLLALGTAGYFGLSLVQGYWRARNKVTYRTAAVTRGEIIYTVSSTGVVQPIRRVTVGSFVSGPILELNVDFNSEVHKDDLLAKIDPRLQDANVARDKATLATQKADVARVTALLEQARNEEKRSQALRAVNERYISDAEMDQYKFARKSLEAQLEVSKANVQQAEANLKMSEANVEYTKITSPVDGIVIDRKIDPGQTVAAAFQTPEMFVVAPEMEKRMYVLAAVDEADIGLIRDAEDRQQPVRFTVDAYPDDLFDGTINQVRLNPVTTQNVVTYTVVVEAPNPGRKLLPGMTANLSFQINLREDILKIPNAALRFYPKPEQVREEDRKLLEGEEEPQTTSNDDQQKIEAEPSAMERVEASRKRSRRHVWVDDGQWLRAIEVHVGLSDNRCTELISGDITEGQELVTGLAPKA